MKTKSLTFIEILITLTILTIISILTVGLLKPAELFQQTRDAKRIAELKNLEKAISLYLTENPNINLGSSSIIYISLPDNSPTCSNWINQLPSGYQYKCSSNPQNIDGTGWLPINFASSSIVNIQKLPIDPINSPPYYYSYTADNNKKDYELTAYLENNKNKGEDSISAKDEGTNIYIYETGSDKKLTPDNFEISRSGPRLEPGSLIWAATSNPSSGHDAIYDAAQDAEYLYIAGFDYENNDYKWRIEKRSKSDGSLIWAATSNPSSYRDWAHTIDVDSNYVYVGGFDVTTIPTTSARWRIEKRNKFTGELLGYVAEDFGVCYNCDDRVNELKVDKTEGVIYIVGRQSVTNSEFWWRIEKRIINDFSIIWVATSNPSTGKDEARSLTMDSDYLYITGIDRTGGKFYWRTEKRRKDTGELVWATTTYFDVSSSENYANKILIFQNNLYIIGNESISSDYIIRCEIRNKNDGSLLQVATSNPSSGVDYPKSADLNSSGLYIAAYQSTPGYPDTSWRIEKRNLTNCGLEWSMISDYSDGSSNDSNGDDYPRAILVDSTGIYISGYDSPPGDSGEWRIEKRAK